MAKTKRQARVPGSIDPSALEREAFQHFPYGIVVVDRDRKIVSSNLQAGRLIQSRGLADGNHTCCELLGCRTPDTVLAESCLTELAIAQGEPLREIRLDLDTSDGVAALWVAAALLKDDGTHVVLQLRPGLAKDRRRRTDPHWMSGPRLRIRALGGTIVESAEGPIGGAWLDQRTGQLLKYLVAQRHRSVHVEEIGESVWQDADFAIAASVRYYIHALRGKLEPGRAKRAQSAFIVARAGGYRLNLDRVGVDVDEFEAHVSAGLAAVETDPQSAETELEKGLALYRGDFLADLPYAEWAILERQRLHDLACMGLRHLADTRLSLHMVEGAAGSLERLATMQPYDEGVHRQLMELDILRGRRSDAVRRYNALRTRMRRTFGHDPDFTPADLTAPKL